MTGQVDSLTIFFPMWNEESSIHMAVDAAREAGDALVESGEIGSYDVLIVNDASTDRTPQLAEAISAADARVRVVHHEDNRGLGGALRTGFSEARGDAVLYTDADLPCDLLETLTKGFRLLRLYDADIVSAYRHDRTAEGPRRAVYSFAYNLLVRFGFDLRIRDVNFAFKLVRRRVFDHVTLDSEGSFIDAELLIKAHKFGYRIIQFGVDYFPRTRGVSTLSSASTIATIVRELVAMRKVLLAIEPLAMESPKTAGRTLADTERAPRKRFLIVNADDYGLTRAVSEGILRAHRDGVVTSTSVLAIAPAFATSAAALRDTGGIGVGVHLALVGEDPPLLPAREIPTLVDRRGRLPISWRAFLARAVRGRIDADDIRRELEAQLTAVQDAGLVLDHLDTHQHLHLWPVVREVVLGLAGKHGIGAVRVPRSANALPGVGVNYLAAELARRARANGITTTGATAGLDEAGQMDGTRFAVALGRLGTAPGSAAELSTHPGEAEDPDRHRYAWGYRWADELALLVDPATRRAIDDAGFCLATYADLVAARRSPGG